MTDPDFDLDGYLRRIELDDTGTPNLALLRAVIAHHSAMIPFENLDIVLGRPIRVDLASVQAKLVGTMRGGYCFEQNTLLRAALEALGFQVASLMGRVMRGSPDGVVPPRSHLMLRVDLPDGPVLADVGFGNLTPTGPLSFGSGAAQATLHEDYRLQPIAGETVLQAKFGTAWENVYRFLDHPTFPIDHEVANWFTSTKPGGLFTTNVIAARPGAACRQTLFNGFVAVRDMENRARRSVVTSEAALRETLHDHFRIALDAREAATVFAAMRGFAERAGAAPRWE